MEFIHNQFYSMLKHLASFLALDKFVKISWFTNCRARRTTLCLSVSTPELSTLFSPLSPVLETVVSVHQFGLPLSGLYIQSHMQTFWNGLTYKIHTCIKLQNVKNLKWYFSTRVTRMLTWGENNKRCSANFIFNNW